MNIEQETRTCQNCKNQFAIEPEPIRQAQGFASI